MIEVKKLELRCEVKKDNTGEDKFFLLRVKINDWPELMDFFEIGVSNQELAAHLEGIADQLRQGPPDKVLNEKEYLAQQEKQNAET